MIRKLLDFCLHERLVILLVSGVLIADSTRIREELGWQPEYESIDEIIRTAWAWHQKEAR